MGIRVYDKGIVPSFHKRKLSIFSKTNENVSLLEITLNDLPTNGYLYGKKLYRSINEKYPPEKRTRINNIYSVI